MSQEGDMPTPVNGRDLPEVRIMPSLLEYVSLISRTTEYFFKDAGSMENAPFKGFLLEGLPGTGKTEIVKQVARNLSLKRPAGRNVKYILVDGASIAAPRWGEAEKALRRVFNPQDLSLGDDKLIILFDDIESLMITRGVQLAKEWHYSINSILFHEIDALDPSWVMLCATTNRPDLVDDAIKTRLFQITIPLPPLEELRLIIDQVLERTRVPEHHQDLVADNVMGILTKLDSPTIRDAEKHTVIECVRNGVWTV